ncbi:SMI1/KNR4 family protein [Thermomonospora amylolytica]|uniref:SMI1/KNR4 family protein n=1 Tax=Thermomonospora amylolytica TaxID=1411117 RepID=UPI000E6B7D54|nr:SMI1/KNR4 family protein [Thermomonospora amylolytica]
MHWAVEQLVAVLEPPAGGGDQVDWERVREEYGVMFPADYRSFVETYGGGVIDDYIGISTPPVEGSVYGHLLGDGPFVSGQRHPEGYPYYPDPGGILLWGYSTHGDDAYWHCTSEDPDEWTVLVFTRQVAYGEDHWKPFGGGMVELLLASIRDGRPSPFSDSTSPSAKSVFTSWRDE